MLPLWEVLSPATADGPAVCACPAGASCERNAGKHPRLQHGLSDASREPDVIRSWWAMWPAAGVAIATGPESRLAVLDVDPRKGGDDALQSMQVDHARIPDSVRVLTGGGGWHDYLLDPDGRVRSAVDLLAAKYGAGLDTRGRGGYVVAPPTLHASGRRYEFEAGFEPGDLELAPVPDWLVSLLEPAAPAAPEVAAELVDDTQAELAAARLLPWGVERVRRGRPRNATGFDVAIQARDNGLSVDRARALLAEFAEAVRNLGDHPYALAEAMKSVAQAYRRPPRAPWGDGGRVLVGGGNGSPPVGTPAQQALVQPEDWRKLLIFRYDAKGMPTKVEPLVHNALVFLTHEEGWRGVLRWDEFGSEPVLRSPPPFDEAARPGAYPRPWRDDDSIRTASWLQQKQLLFVGQDVVAQAALATARKNPFHPVREYLDGLSWDGVERLDEFLVDYFGAPAGDYARAVGPRWLISAVARIYRPGAKADHVLILEGAQGLLKSTALKRLAGDAWFTDEIDTLGTKDAAQQIQGAWIVEMAELDALGRTEISRVKAFMSKTFDRYRPPYLRNVVRFERQCVFAGSVNHAEYLRDETGNRRFWPVRCTEIDLEGITQNRDQLWAEAVVRFRKGEAWWLDTPELAAAAKDEQEARFVVDWWESEIEKLVADKREQARLGGDPVSVSIGECLAHLKLDVAKAGQTEQNRIQRSLKHLGMERRRVRLPKIDGGGLTWRYFPSTSIRPVNGLSNDTETGNISGEGEQVGTRLSSSGSITVPTVPSVPTQVLIGGLEIPGVSMEVGGTSGTRGTVGTNGGGRGIVGG